jgi:iron complex outermembrane receptor protein/vitamin B12 transporter
LLQAALRYDDPDGFDAETSTHLGASYEFGPGLSLAANWGQAFKLPSFFALGHALVGNPQLQPEKADAWDLGLAWEASPGLRLEATYFYNDFEDLITFDDEAFVNVNRDRVETSGVELQALWLPLARLSLQGQATYTDIDVEGSDVPLTGRPEWTAGLLVQWRISRSWDSSLDYQYTGEQHASSRHTGEARMTKLDDYHRVDWVLRWSPTSAWQLQLSVDNLFDEGYQSAVGFPGPGRSLRLGFRFTHN